MLKDLNCNHCYSRRNGKKILERLRKRDDVEFAPVVNQWISLYNLEEKDLLEQDVHET